MSSVRRALSDPDNQKKASEGMLRLSTKDKIWVILAIIAIVIGFAIAVIYDL